MTSSDADDALLIEEEFAQEPAPFFGARSSAMGPGETTDEAGLLGEELLALAREDVDRLLHSIPSGLLEARKFIASELWPAPRPEELQSIVKLAMDTDLSSFRSRLARTMLALRLLAEREARSFWDDFPLDADEIRLRARRKAGVLGSLAAFGDPTKLTWGAGHGIDSHDREFLAQVARALLPRPDRLLAATILSPRLALVLETGGGEALKDLLPSVSRDETEILGDSREADENFAVPLRRICLQVAAARWLMHDDLFEWDALAPAATGEGARPADSSMDDEALRDLDAARQGRLSECLLRLREDECVYRAVSSQLQFLQDHTLKAGRKDLTDLLIRLRRPLLASYTRLAVIVRSPTATSFGLTQDGAAQRNQPDAAAPTAGDEETEKIYEAAVTSLKAKQYRIFGRLAPALRQRRRIIALSSALVLLVVSAPIVLLNLPAGPVAPLEFAASDSISLKLLSATPVGTMIYAQVDDYWSRLSEDQRREKLDDLARLATEKGFQAIFLTDSRGEPVAKWELDHGTTSELTSAPDLAATQP